MEQSTTDLLMFIEEKGNGPIRAESRLALNTEDSEMTDGFVDGSFFEISNFDLGLRINDSQSDATEANSGKPGPAGATPNLGGQFLKWRRASDEDYKTLLKPAAPGQAPTYKASLEEFTFTRQIDGASTRLFQLCVDSTRLARAAMIKRRGVGQGAKGKWLQEVSFRLDFDEPLIVAVDWDDGELVTEKCTLSFRSATMRYRTIDVDGTPGAVRHATWKQPGT